MSRIPFFTIGLPQLPYQTDPRIEPDLRDVYNALRNLAYQVGQYGGFEAADEGLQNVDSVEITAGAAKRRIYCEALEAMTYGELINLTQSGGTTKARYANGTDGTKPCWGINNTPGTCAIGDTIEVVLPGCYVTSIGGLTHGERYFLSTTDGLLTNVAPAAAGNAVQAVGFALDDSVFFFFPNVGFWTV